MSDGARLDALYAAVYASPDDDAPRQVLADALLELGDPRGELIALQLAPRRDLERERALLDAHGAAWSAAFRDAGGVTFERGFPAHLTLSSRTTDAAGADLPPLEITRAWRTLVSVRRLEHVPAAIGLAVAALPALRELDGGSALIGELLRVPRPWTRLHLTGLLTPQMLAAMPELRALQWTAPAIPRGLLAATQLVELSLAPTRPPERVDLPPTLERLEVSAHRGFPRLDLAQTPRLAYLSLSGPGAVPAALPASLEKLRVRYTERPLPAFAIAAGSRLRDVQITEPTIGEHDLAPFAHVAAMQLTAMRDLHPRALSRLRALRELEVSAPGELRDDLGGLAALERLTVHAGGTRPALAGTAIHALAWRRLDPDGLRSPLPLRTATLAAPGDAATLPALFARYPLLTELQLVHHGDWRAPVELARLARDSGLRRLSFDGAITLVRDRGGEPWATVVDAPRARVTLQLLDGMPELAR
nr:TIGR02996 domain-containing protein [Kofleriaceae bacterium]